MSKKDMKEISSTGGGAPAADQGQVTPGSGEGVATKYGYVGAGGKKSKKKKDLIRKKFAESKEVDLALEYKRLFKKDL